LLFTRLIHTPRQARAGHGVAQRRMQAQQARAAHSHRLCTPAIHTFHSHLRQARVGHSVVYSSPVENGLTPTELRFQDLGSTRLAIHSSYSHFLQARAGHSVAQRRMKEQQARAAHSHRLFTLAIHTSGSHIHTLPIHTVSSHVRFTPPIHRRVRVTQWRNAACKSSRRARRSRWRRSVRG